MCKLRVLSMVGGVLRDPIRRAQALRRCLRVIGCPGQEAPWGPTGTRLDPPESWKCPGALAEDKAWEAKPERLLHPFHLALCPPEAAKDKRRQEEGNSGQQGSGEQNWTCLEVLWSLVPQEDRKRSRWRGQGRAWTERAESRKGKARTKERGQGASVAAARSPPGTEAKAGQRRRKVQWAWTDSWPLQLRSHPPREKHPNSRSKRLLCHCPWGCHNR